MAERPLYTLYKNLKAQNYDVPNDYNKFESALTRDGKGGADNRHAIYENLKAQNFDVPDTYERFYSALFEPRSKTSSRAKGGSVPMSAADRARFSAGAAAISESAKQIANNAGRYNRLKQRKQRQLKDFGRVNLGTHLTPFGGDANDVVKDEFAYNPETGNAGAYVTSDNETAYTQSDAEQKQAILDKYGEEWNKAVDMGMVPSELDKADPGLSDTDVSMRQMERRQEWLDENQNRRSKELNESMHLQGSPFVASGGAVAPSSFNAAIGNEANRLSDAEYGAYNTAKAYNQMLRTTLLQELKEQKQRNENAGWWKDKWNDVSNYFGGMFDTMLDPKLYSQGVMDAAIASNLLQVKKGMEDGTIKKGSNAGNAAQVMLSAIQQQQGEAAKQQQYGTKAYQYGDMSGRSLKFMADFALSGWRNVITTGFTKAGEKVGEKMALGALGKWFTKNTGRVLGDMAGSAALAATNQLGSTYNNVIERYVGMNNENGGVTQDKNGDLKFNEGVSLGKAIKDGLGSATIENFSEMFGEYLPGASKLLSKLGLSKVSSFFEKIGNNAYYKWLSNATNKSGIQGVMSEIAEEEFGTALHAAWGDGDGSWSDFNVFTNPDAREKQIDTCLGMFYSVGFMQSPRTAVGAINAVKYFSIKLQVTKADKFGQMMFGDNWEEIKSKIDVTTNADLTKTVLDATRSDSMTAKQKGAVINYAMFLSKLRGFNQASDAKTKDKVEEGETVPTLSNYLDDAYTEGHNADDADKHEIQLDQEDKQKSLAQLLGISDQQLASMSDDELEALSGRNDNIDRAIYDYQLSTARYQGVVDDAQDRVDLAAHHAAQKVDMYTDQSRGSVRNATIKASGGAEDYGVYIISGNIATNEDGSINVSGSDSMILYYDPTTDSVEHADALMFAELGEELPADDVKTQAVADAKENAIKEIAGIIDGTVDVGSQFTVTDADGTEHTYEVLADNGDGTAMITIDGNIPTKLVKGENVNVPVSFEELQKMKDESDQQRLQAAKAQREQMEKERAEQQNQAQTTQAENPAQESNTQSAPIEDNLDYSDIIREDGKVQMVDVSDKDGNNLFPDAKDVFYIQGNKMRTKFAYIDANGELKTQGFPTGLVKIKTRGEVSVDDYKKYRNTILAAESSAMPESSMIEGNSGENRGGIEAKPTTIEDETTPDVAENTETTAPAEKNAEKTQQTPAITLEDGTIVPMLEDGNPDFSKLSAAQTAELYDTQFDEDADGIVSGYVSDAKKALDKANNMTVKGKTFVEQKAAKAAKEKAIADAQAAYDSAIAIRDAYNERQLAKEENTPEGRKSLIEKARRKFTRLKNSEEWSERTGDLWNETVGKLLHRLYDATGIDVFDDTPNTVYEYVAENVGPYSLNYEGNDNSKGVQQETGLSRSDFAKLGWLAAEGKGMTIDAKVHRLWENRPSNLESADTQEIRNALISLITSGQTAFQARDYILNQRIELAESALEEQLRQEEDAAEAQKAKEEEEKKKAEEEKTNENRNAPELSHEQQKAKEEGEKLGFPAVDKEGEPINQNVIELANWAKEQGLEIDPTSKLNSYADLYVMCKGGFGVSMLVPDVGEDINQVFYFPDNVQGEQLAKLQEEFNVGRDLKHSADMNSELTEGAMFYDGDTAREFKEFVDKKVEMQNKVFGEQRPEEDLPFSAKDNGTQQTSSERAADVEKNKVDDIKVVDNIVGKKTRKTLEKLAKMMGANVQWQYSDKNANGWFDDKTNTIYLTLDSSITEGVQFIFGHEMTHEMRTKNPAAYDELKNLVKDMMGEDTFNKETDRITSLYNENNVFYNGGRTAYEEEVVADQLGKWIRDANYAHTLLLKMSHPLLARLHEIVNRFLMALRGIEISDDMNLILRSIEQAYVKTAKGEVENSETGENVSFSLRLKSAIEETETNPSDAQKESGNYKKGHIKFGGYDYTIENPKGSTRSGKDANGKEWKVTMHDTYGYIRGKFGKDGDHLDMFINDKADLDNWNGDVFVVDQVNPDGSFDEHKVMYGYDSMNDAEKAYLANYSKGWQGLGGITGASKDEFDKWLGTSNRKLKPFADYAKVKFSQAQSVAEPRQSLDDIKPVSVGAFGNIYNQFRGKAKAAIEFLKKLGSGEATAALHHHTIGDISLVWGDKKTGLDKILRKHPEVVDNLQSIIDSMEVVKESDNRIKLESPTHFAVVSKEYKGEPREQWLLTAYEKRESLENDKSMDTATSSLGGDTALSQSKGSGANIDNSSETAKENGEKFSLKDEKTLAGVHNITEEKLRKALKLGGFANPSLAVIDTNKSGHNNFGEISFIAPSALLDKRTGKTAGTWITDAYTQRYPSVEREMSEKGYRKFEGWVDSLDYPSGVKAEIERQAKDALSDNNAPAWELMYLKEKGIDIKAYDSNVDYRWKEIISDHPTAEDILNSMKTDPELNEKVTSLAKHVIIYPTWEKVSLEVRRKIYKETGVKKSPISPIVRQQTKEIFERDYKSTLLNKDGSPRKKDVKKVVEDIVKEHNDTKKYDFYLSKVKASGYVNKNGLYDDYIRWQEKKLDEFGTKNRIFRGYKPDGTRKYVPETLDNVSKVMREEADGQTNGSEYTSFGSFIAKVASRVDSTDEMRDNKDKLSSNEDKEKFYEKWENVYYDLSKFLYNDVFYGEQRLHDIVLQSDPKKYAKKEYDITLTPTFMKKLDALKNAVQTELKSAYFETKYNRPLRLNEFAAAVVPDNLGEDVRKGIEDAGLPMYNYDPNKEGDRNRAFNEAVNSSDNIRFSLKEEKEKIVADAKANGTYMTAPNGEKTKLDAEQWATVRTTNFKNWFGDWENDPENASKLVDENGEPMVVYHGTTNDETIKVWNEKAKTYDTSHEPFTVFKRAVDGLPNSGMFFNSSENNAYEYGYNHYAVYLNAKNPLVIDCKGNLYNSIKHEGKTMDTYDWANWAEENGFDGVIFKNIKDGVDYGSMQNTTDDYVVFYSNQIKSSENNNGDFYADNNDIRFSLRNLDQEYLDAVKKGDMEKAQRLVNKAAAVAGYSTDSSYQGTSAFNGSAPWGNGYFLTKEERKEAWNNGEFEGESTLGDYINDDIDGGNLEALTDTASYRAADPMRKEAIDNVRNAIQKKSKFITMYRSVPSDVKEGSFRNGDWITPSRSYAVDNAKLHGWGNDYNIIEQKVPVDDVWFDGNDIAEWGYGIEKDYINDTDFAYKNVKNNRKLLDVVTYNDNGEVIPLSQRFDPSKSDTRFSLRGSTPYDKQMEEWMEKNHLEKGAVPMEKPIMGEGENIFDYANRMVEWTRNQNLWKTAPKQTGFQDALEKWKADNGLSPDAYPPVRPNRENYSTEIGYAEDLEKYNKKKELWKSAPKPKDFDLSVDLEDMNKQLRNIRRAVLNQKNYDQRTVKAVSDLVRKMLNIGWGDGLSRGKVGNLLSAAKNATGANDVKKYLDKAMGILAENYLNRLSTAYDNLINTKGARADQSGVIKMGSLDANGQAFMSEYKKAINMDDSSLNTYIANIEEDSAKNEDNVEMNDYRLAGIQAAIMFKQQIGGNDADIAELQRQIGELKNKKDATKEDKELLKSLEKKLFENKFDRITMYENLLNNIQRMVTESKGRAKEFREEIAEHKNEILHRANLDLEGVDSTYYDTTTAKKKLVNNVLQRAVFSSTYTFEQFLKFFGKKAANGEGYLYNYFTKLNQDALDEEQLYNEMNRNALDEKTKELFGKKKFMKLVGIDGNGMKEMDIEVTDYSNKKTGKRTIHLKQGQMLYIYLVNKETDGEMKLRAMGITEEDVDAIEANLDPRVKVMGEWLQDEYLPECQRRYQATHTKYFGAPMKEVENYFPLSINNRARNVKEDVNQDTDAMSQLAGTSTGAIVTRRVNVIPLDIENTDAFEVAFNHLQEMEEWSAMLPFRQDVNTLLSYTHFRNQVQNMSSVAYGSGKTLWDEFKQTAQIAAGTYKPKVNAGMMDSRIAAAMGGVAVAKISGRLWTAIKQSQSATVFLPECDFTRFVKNGVNPYGSWKWAMENIPDFRKRVENMTYGDVKLRQYLDELEKYHDWTKVISKLGMAPNILVDGVTCAVGARSVYETEVNRLTKLGYPKEKAEEKAYYKAVAAYNKTQQSSGGMYLSPMQVDRTYVSAALSLFKNANFAYGRMQIEACRGLARTYDFWGGKHKTALIESMTRQIMEEDGLDENTARAIAKATYNRTFRQSIGRLINFATLVPVSWALYKALPYLLTGDDDDKKKDMIEEAVLKGFATSLSDNYVIPFASNILNAGLKVEDGKPTFDPEVFRYQNLYINPATSDLANIYSMIGNQKWYSVANKFGMLGVQSLIGFNPETVGSLYQAFAEADKDNGNTAKEWQIGILKAISAPEESIRELYMDELGLKNEDIKKIPLAELEKRYTERQINRDNLLSQIFIDAENFNGYVDKYQKSFEKKIKDKMDKWDEYDKKKADEFFDTTLDPKLKDMIAKKRAKDANAAADEQIAKEGLNQEKNGKEPYEEAYDAAKMSIDVAEDNAISTYNKVLNKRYAALNDEYNNQTDAMKYIFMSNHPNFKAYKDLESEYTTYGKKMKELKEKLVSADGYDAKQTILKQIRAEREKFSELQSKVR